MRSLRLTGWAALLALSCARGAPGDTPPGGPSSALVRSGEAPTAPLAASATPAEPPAPSGSWVEAARQQRWAEAARLIDELSPEQRAQPGVRYARSRAALELGDHARAVRELGGLEKELPLLASEIARDRAAAELEAGPWESAAAYYAKRGDPKSQIRAAVAFERAGKLAEGRAAVDNALAQIRRLKQNGEKNRLEAEARGVRARLAEKSGEHALAAADLRWIATATPAASEAEGVDERLSRLGSGRSLTARERIERAWALAEAGHVDKTERELELLGTPNGIGKAELLRARGWALYQARRDYAKASDLLESAARLGSKEPARDLFYAARARSRAHEDERAIALYGKLGKQYPGSYWAEQAEYLSARLHYIAGRWSAASSGYEAYLKRYGKKARNAGSARHEQAIAWLAAGQHRKAEPALVALAEAARSEHDRALYRELTGVAQAGAGSRDKATESYKAVIRDVPLSFGALAARSRLEALGVEPPPAIGPPKSSPPPVPLQVKLPAKVRLLVSLGLDADAERELSELEDSIKKEHAPRSDEALCQAYSELSSAAQRYRAGLRAARWSLLSVAPEPATRWLWDCIYPRPYEPVVREAAAEQALSVNLVYAVMRQESGFRPAVVSPANAVGLLQLIPPTALAVAGELGIEYDPLLLKSPPTNVRMGSYYLAKVLAMFGGNVALGAAAYNAGPGAVSRWLEGGEKLPLDLFVARIPYGETRGYVTRVVGNLARYAYLEGGVEAVPKLELELEKGLRAPVDAY
jgi:soluble lytic murein transglycosylase